MKLNAMKLAMPLFVALAYGPAQGWALPLLGTDLASFAVLGATPDVTNTGATTLIGQVGISPALSITGLIGITVNGTNGADIGNPNVHLGDATATAAQIQLALARTSLGLLGPGFLLGNADLTLAGTLAPGVYSVPGGAALLTGSLTLDGGGNANALWVFQIASSFDTSFASVVNVINTGAGAGVYWNVGSTATLGATTTLEGNILASTSILMGDGVTIGCGRALAHTGTVTMINDTIDAIGCTGTGEEGSNGLSGGLTVTELGGTPTVLPFVPVSGGAGVPEPGTLLLFGFGVAGLFAVRKRLLPVA